MNLLLRLLLVVLRAALGRKLGADEASVLRLRVLPNDLDLNGHMNNGRFMTLMDLGRMDLMVRLGLLGHARRRRWAPLVGGAMIRYRRSLRLFQRFELHSRVIGWDDKWFVFEQRFESGGALCATALVRALFRAPGGNVPPAEVLQIGGFEPEARPLPEHIARWAEAEDAAYESARGG